MPDLLPRILLGASGHSSLLEIEKLLGSMPQHLPTDGLLRPTSGLLEGPEIYLWSQKGWAVQVKVSDEGAAQKVGRRLFKELVPKRNLQSHQPYLHDLPLFVIHKGGWVQVPPPGKPVKVKTGPSISDQRHLLQLKGEGFFGTSGFVLGGKNGDYRVAIKPTKKEHKGVFGSGSFHAPTLVELEKKVDQAIEKIQTHLAKGR